MFNKSFTCQRKAINSKLDVKNKEESIKKLSVLILIFVLSTLSYTFADVSYNFEAEKLKEIGVFKGTDNGFELNRTANS
ncbi:MAG: hypothetical protein WBA54_11535 [Acidaminobacteraceae bacterium]